MLPRSLGGVLWICAALFSRASAKVTDTITDTEIQLGKPFKISWTTDSSPVRLELQLKDSKAVFQPFKTISERESGDKYEWTPPTDLPSGEYNFVFTDAKGESDIAGPFLVTSSGELPKSEKPSTTTASQGPSGTGAPPNSATASGASSTPTPSSSDSPPNNTKGSSGGLSTSAKAGIGAGVGISGVALTVLSVLLLRRGLRTNKEDPAPEESGESAVLKPPSKGILKGLPRSLSPAFAKLRALPKLNTKGPFGPTTDEDRNKAVMTGEIAELPAGNLDLEVPDRHELPTPANTPELPGESKESLPRWV